MTACLYGCADARLYPGGWLCDQHAPRPVNPEPDPDRTAAVLRARYGMTGGPSSAHLELRRQRQMESGQGYFSAQAAERRALERGAALRGVRPDAPATSHALAARLSPLRERTVRLEVFALVAAWTPAVGGLTDDDLERLLRRAHQSVSATRNALVADGYLTDSGTTRLTRYGNAAVVWQPAPAAADLRTRYARRAAVQPEGPFLPWHDPSR